MTRAMPVDDNEKLEIDRLVSVFFHSFSNHDGRTPTVDRIRDLLIPEGMISKCVSVPAEVFTVDAFIAPRQELLSNGSLREFQEVETSEHTLIMGHIAQRVCTYEKSGVLHGTPFTGRGVKMFQFIRTVDGWRISSVTWDDEREGFTLDHDWRIS